MAKRTTQQTSCFHNDPANHVESPDKYRKDWIRVSCRKSNAAVGLLAQSQDTLFSAAEPVEATADET